MSRQLVQTVCFLSILFLVPLTPDAWSGGGEEGTAPATPPARQIPGINAEDHFPRGCVDCHINRPEQNMDVRLSTLMEKLAHQVDLKLLAKAQAATPAGVELKGKHPVATAALRDIPAGCFTCHDNSSKRAPFFPEMMHIIHLTGGEGNHYLTLFQGECVHCHKLDAKTGKWSVPSGPEK